MQPYTHVAIFINSDGVWMMDCSQDDNCTAVTNLFGSPVVPLPWFGPTSEKTVRDGLTRQNPGVVIVRLKDEIRNVR